ncbi:MAG TPA: DUF397 domain-containing protein [Candidatus Saccharimonadia bacterium]|nr:DUF397 domain-containing protein [Candidatus Saccharimonadia bacterium]
MSQQENSQSKQGTKAFFCAEVDGVALFESSYSNGNGACVVVGRDSKGNTVVGDSKDLSQGLLRYTPREWKAFVAGVKSGEFDTEN